MDNTEELPDNNVSVGWKPPLLINYLLIKKTVVKNFLVSKYPKAKRVLKNSPEIVYATVIGFIILIFNDK